jgi:DNA polymerase-1
MKAACDEEGGMLYAQYNQTVTQNTRLSSSGRKYKLQFQNFPRRYKRMFRARYAGWYVAEGDGVGMEFRIGAHLTRDAVALADIRGKKDVHKATAREMLKKPEAAVTSDERQYHKPETFRPMYGSKGQTPEQQAYARYFQGRYKAMYDEQTRWTYQVLKDKKITTEWGFHFYWPDCTMDRSGYIKYKTNIFNYPMSSFATGEIIPITLVFVWHYLKALKLNAFLTNTIHDSVVGEVPEYEKDEFTGVCNRAFTSDTLGYLSRVYHVDLVVPLGVEIKYGTNWSGKDGGESIYELDPLEDVTT